MCVHAHVHSPVWCACNFYRGLRKALDNPPLELEIVVSSPTYIRRTEPGSSAKVISVLNHQATSPSPLYSFITCPCMNIFLKLAFFVVETLRRWVVLVGEVWVHTLSLYTFLLQDMMNRVLLSGKGKIETKFRHLIENKISTESRNYQRIEDLMMIRNVKSVQNQLCLACVVYVSVFVCVCVMCMCECVVCVHVCISVCVCSCSISLMHSH